MKPHVVVLSQFQVLKAEDWQVVTDAEQQTRTTEGLVCRKGTFWMEHRQDMCDKVQDCGAMTALRSPSIHNNSLQFHLKPPQQKGESQRQLQLKVFLFFLPCWEWFVLFWFLLTIFLICSFAKTQLWIDHDYLRWINTSKCEKIISQKSKNVDTDWFENELISQTNSSHLSVHFDMEPFFLDKVTILLIMI